MFSAGHPHLFQVEQHAAIKSPRGGVLIRRRQDGSWDLPGGPLRAGRGWKQSLAEEIEAQTGILHFELRSILEVDSRDEHGETFYTVVFACTLPEFEALVLSKEREDSLWLTLGEMDSFEFRSAKTKQRLHRILADVPLPN
jgi:ADP-ribose pyrophosphatase YjhB (NUDIX family)